MGLKASKEKILEVTTGMLARLPMDEVTVREIAKTANVNIGSIHYYFSAKEILFNAAIETMIIKGLDEWMTNNGHREVPSNNDLVNLLEFLHQGCIDHREFAKTRIRTTLNVDQISAANLKVYETIYKLAKDLKLEADNKKLKIKVSLLFSSLASISCSPEEMNAFTGLTLSKKAHIKRYVKEIVEIIFPNQLSK